MILLPGFVLNRAYYSGPFSKKYLQTNIVADIGASLPLSALIHWTMMIWAIPIYCSITKQELCLDFQYIGMLLSGVSSVKEINAIFNNVSIYYDEIIKYFITSLIIGRVLGTIFRRVVRLLKLDLIFKKLRYDNEWYYLLTGEVLGWRGHNGIIKYLEILRDLKRIKYPETPKGFLKQIKFFFAKLFYKVKIPVSVQITALLGEEKFIIKGEVHEFFLKRDDLESVVLKRALIYPFKVNKLTDNILETNDGYHPSKEQIINATKLDDYILILREQILTFDLDYKLKEFRKKNVIPFPAESISQEE